MMKNPRRDWRTERSDYQFVVSGLDGRTFTIVTPDSGRVAYDGLVSGVLHENNQEPHSIPIK
jgi:hypothetical protein